MELKKILFISAGILFIIALILIVLSLLMGSEQQAIPITNNQVDGSFENHCPVEDCFKKVQFEIPEEFFIRILNRNIVIEILGIESTPFLFESSGELSPVDRNNLVVIRLDEPSEDILFLPLLPEDLLFVDEVIIRDIDLEVEYLLTISSVESQTNFPNHQACPTTCETTTLIVE